MTHQESALRFYFSFLKKTKSTASSEDIPLFRDLLTIVDGH